MGRYIVVIDDVDKRFDLIKSSVRYYLIWSTVVDAPITYGLNEKELRKFWKEEFGNSGMVDFDNQLSRAVERANDRIVSIDGYNRAGPEECKISFDEIVEFYCRRKIEITKTLLKEYRKSKNKLNLIK